MSGVPSRAAADTRQVVTLRCVKLEVALESVSRQSPKMALGPTLLGLKQAAKAKKCQRIAGRLAALAGAKRAGTTYVRDVGGPDMGWRAVAAQQSYHLPQLQRH